MRRIGKLLVLLLVLAACNNEKNSNMEEEFPVSFMVLEPGHFHASLVLKEMYPEVSPNVHVFAPEGMELDDFLKRVEAYNTRAENPTSWELTVYTKADYLEKMLAEKPGNVVVLAGNNRNKTESIKACVDAGLHVYSDKPMAINASDNELLFEAFDVAVEKDLLLLDIMTERFEITTMLQKKFSKQEHIFGTLVKGSIEEPAITKESVHHFFKYVSGAALQRPAWFFDTEQQGEAIADVGTHLVDLVMWEAFPEGVENYTANMQILKSQKWSTVLDQKQFKKATGLDEFPDFLSTSVVEGKLEAMSNSSIHFTVNNVHAKVSVEWAFQAPEGAGDTHYSIMRGTLCDLIIQQGQDEDYKPVLYVKMHKADFEDVMKTNIQLYLKDILEKEYPGISFEIVDAGFWRINVPNKYKVGHEAHFAQVTRKYLDFFKEGSISNWELKQMKGKYYTTVRSVQLAD